MCPPPLFTTFLHPCRQHVDASISYSLASHKMLFLFADGMSHWIQTGQSHSKFIPVSLFWVLQGWEVWTRKPVAPPRPPPACSQHKTPWLTWRKSLISLNEVSTKVWCYIHVRTVVVVGRRRDRVLLCRLCEAKIRKLMESVWYKIVQTTITVAILHRPALLVQIFPGWVVQSQQAVTTDHSSKKVLLVPNLTVQSFVNCLPISGGKFAAISCIEEESEPKYKVYTVVVVVVVVVVFPLF